MISREAASRAVRLQTMEVPATRLAGLAVVCALMPLHNAAVLGTPRWSSVGSFALAASLFAFGSWLILKAFFVRCRMLPLGDIFLIADVVLLLYAVDLSGGPRSWLFLLLAGRCVDQVSGGFRRAVWFNHLLIASYALYLLSAAIHRPAVPWTEFAFKLALLYSFNWYASLTGQTVDSLRARARRTQAAKRSGAEMAGTVVHAIRTSTDGIAVLTDLLSQTSLDVRQERYVRGLVRYRQDLLNKIGLLHASTAETDSTALQEAPFSPRALVEDIASLLRPLAESKGLDLRVELDHRTPLSICGDSVRLRQVLLSLSHNAIRFTDVGSVLLTCGPLWPGQVAFQVRDSGPGIPAHVCKRVSERFVRADGTLWQRSHGAQVGLSISKRLVDSMGGRLVLHSVPGQGATVSVELPLLGRSFFETGKIPARALVPSAGPVVSSAGPVVSSAGPVNLDPAR
jgi:signal transduction histidine kinase